MRFAGYMVFAILLTCCISCTYLQVDRIKNMDSQSSEKTANRLIKETSPYLKQHAYNPVDWYPWGEGALQKAKIENKLLIVSIGYSACHWCHVMEHESFEDEVVAKIMNKNFVCVKVDREERPDVDNIYMDALHLMGKQGGWPLNCFALPDGTPVFGGTYYPKNNWIQLMNQLKDMYANDEQKMLGFAAQVKSGMEQQLHQQIGEGSLDFKEEQLVEMVNVWEQSFDMNWGGSKGAPKFPMPVGLNFLMQYYYYTENKSIKNYLETTLDKIAAGGIYDHLGGGFARYSTDPYWKVPHFEKMLYDNAQLVSVYSQGYKLFRKESYKDVIYETLAFMEREMKSESGGFYSALDADSEGVEGKFYVWEYDEVLMLLGDKTEVFSEYYSLKKNGNWEKGINVIHNETALEIVADKYKMSILDVEDVLAESKRILFEARKQRVFPGADTKVLTAWNAMVITAFVNAFKAFGEQKHLSEALELANYLKREGVSKDGDVIRMKRTEASEVPGFLDDYSLLSQAYLDLYEITFDENWLLLSREITDKAISHFFDSASGMFYFNDTSDVKLFANKQEITDNVIPSSNSVMANNLYRLGVHFEDSDYVAKSENMLSGVYDGMPKYGAYFSNWGVLAMQYIYSPPEVVFVGEDALLKLQEWNKKFYYANIAGAELESNLPLLKNRCELGRTQIYVCRNKVCKLPVARIEDAFKQIKFK